jgi:hypothetical protein
LRGRLTVLLVDGEPLTQDIEVAAFDSVPFDIDALVDSPYAAAFVEIDGGGGLVEQKATDPAGESVAACANSSAASWYLAAGDTLDGSVDELVLSNPHDYPAVVDLTLATERGTRVPEQYQSFLVPARAVRTIDVNTIIGDQSRIGVSVVASRGRVVVGRSQLLDTADRAGYVMTLAAPAVREQWWFVYGERAANVVETYYLYNPGEEDAEVTPVLLGFQQPPGMATPETIVVPDGEVVEFRMADVEGLPETFHSVVFGTEPTTPVVVERVLTRTIDTVPTTSITVGATTRPDGYVASAWHVGLGPAVGTESALAVYNNTTSAAVVDVESITPQGVQPVPGLVDVAVGPGAISYLDLTDELALDHQLIVRSTTQLFVERVLPREPDAQGRVAVWAVPANA